jgi:FkbH-like protein
MKYYIFRNSTIENLFGNAVASYSGYANIMDINKDAEIFIWFYLLPVKPNRKDVVNEVASYFNNIQLIYQQIPSNKTFLIFTLHEFYSAKYQNSDYSVELAIEKFNNQIIEFANQQNNVKVIDFGNFIHTSVTGQLMDWKYYFISKMQINPQLAKPFKIWFTQQTDAIQLKRKKCLVLDLDNTLWGGILGEDGIEGIQIGNDYPGSAFSFFQQSLIELYKTGIILTICSKNNETDVLEAWERNPYLILKKEHIAAYRINWNNKADNIKELADELNIGLDSFVFIDDNVTERELVKQLLPMVEVPDFPQQPYMLPVFIESLQKKYFGAYALTDEDKTKTEQYKANAQRTTLQKNINNFADYLASLEMTITIQKANQFNIPRIAQMLQKTNQFNLTTKRYTEADINGMEANINLIYCISVKDKFGDNGITGAIILKKLNENSAEIDSLLLSCRILGKGIENVFVFKILGLLKKQGINTIFGIYIPSTKNHQVNDFYEKIGFQLINEQNGAKKYKIDMKDTKFLIEPYYKIEM